MTSKQQIKLGAVLSYVQIAVGAVITLLYTPFIIRVLGQSEYGLYNTVSSVVASLSILNLGFGSSYVRFFSRYKAKNDEVSIAKLNGMFMIIFSALGTIAFTGGIFLSENLHMVFAQGLTQMEYNTARKLMLLLTINLAVSFPCSVFTSIITANEKFVFQKLMLIAKQVVSPLACIPLLLMGYASVGMVISMVAIYFAIDIGNAWYCVRRLNTKFVFNGLDKEVFKELGTFSFFIAINMIVDQINLNIDKMLLGRFRGTIAVAVYSAGYTLYHYYMTFSTSISNVFTPHIHKIENSIVLSRAEKDTKLTELFVKVGRIQFSILFLVCSGLVLFGRQFIHLWAGPTYGNAYWVVLLLAVSAIVPLSQNVGIEIQRAKNKHQFRSLLYLLMAIINLLLSIYLCQVYGEIGSAAGTAISFIVVNTILMNIYYSKALAIRVSEYWKACLKIVVSAIPAFGVGSMFCWKLPTEKIQMMLLGIVLYAFCYTISLYLLACSSEERKELKGMLLKTIKRKK